MTKVEKKSYDAQRYLQKRELRMAQNIAWRTANPDRFNAAIRQWRHTKRDHRLKVAREYDASNVSRLRVAKARWRNNNRDKLKAAQDRYLFKNPGARAIIWGNRRGAHRSLLSPKIPGRLLRIQSNACAHCKKYIRAAFHVDHIIPLSRGGLHREGNLQLLCGPCNLSKGARLPIEWRAWLLISTE